MDVAGRVSKVSGRTPLHHAAQAGGCEGVELLLESKAPQVSDKRGLTPLHVAVARRDEQLGIVQTLLAHMADDAAQVNAADEQEMTPLHHAVACGRLATVETLLAVRGIEVDARDRYGRTPMMLAAARGGRASLRNCQTFVTDIHVTKRVRQRTSPSSCELREPGDHPHILQGKNRLLVV